MAYLNKEQLKKIIEGRPTGSTEQQVIESLIKKGHTFEGIEYVPVGVRAKLEPQKQEPVQTKGALQKVGEFIGETTGFTGTAKAVTGAALGGYVAENISDKVSQGANELIAKAKTYPRGSIERKKLLEQAMQLSEKGGQAATGLLNELPTTRQAIGSMAKLGLTAATMGSGGVAANLGLKGAVGLATRVAEGGIMGALFQATDNMEKQKKLGENVGTAAIIGGSIPLIGAGLSKAKELLQKTGQKIQYGVIKPNASDIKDGFDINTIKKNDLGGSLGQMAHKTQDRLNTLTQELQSKVKRTDVAVDLNDVYERTIKSLSGNKAGNFGNINSTKRVAQQLADEIEEATTNGLTDLAEAQTIKQAAGLKGSWVYGSADPDASAVEKVYTAFYRELKKEIENKAPAGVAELNKQISELIPVMNAIVRRIPVAERNALFSLTDVIGAGFSAVHPSGAALLAINKLSKSGRVGNLLSKIESKAPITNIGKRIFGIR
jgi:hypothetical protein